MMYVPIVPHTPMPPLSPRTRELAGILSKVLDEYMKAHPKATKAEIKAAIRMANQSVGPGGNALGLALSVGLGVLMAVLGLGFFVFQGGAGEIDFRSAMPMIVISLIIGLGLVAVLVKAMNR